MRNLDAAKLLRQKVAAYSSGRAISSKPGRLDIKAGLADCRRLEQLTGRRIVALAPGYSSKLSKWAPNR